MHHRQQLQRPAAEIADDVTVADYQLVSLLWSDVSLLSIPELSVKVLAESVLYPIQIALPHCNVGRGIGQAGNALR